MSPEEQALVEKIVREAIRDEFPILMANRECLVDSSGVNLEEHKDHHKLIHKLLDDIGNTRKAFVAGVVTTVTGGILWLAWFFFKHRMKGVWPWLQ